jgi:hypothetical protein
MKKNSAIRAMVSAISIFVLFVSINSPVKAQKQPAVRSEQTRTARPFFAITIDRIPNDDDDKTKNIDKLAASIKVLVDAAAQKGTRIVTRIIIDPVDADAGLPYPLEDTYRARVADQMSIYKKAAERIRRIGSGIMVELADSHDMYVLQKNGALQQKARVYLSALGDDVDIWEIGNEVNGEWTGLCDKNTKDTISSLKDKCRQIPDAVEKLKTAGVDAQESLQAFIAQQIIDAHKVINDAHKQTALTLYYNDDCEPGSNCDDIDSFKIDKWIRKNLDGKEFEHNLTYVFLSFYEDDCPTIKRARIRKDPGEKVANQGEIDADISKWAGVFTKLALTFAPAYVGFGEMAPRCVIEDCKDRTCRFCVTQQDEFIQRYYSLYHPDLTRKVPGYVGGYFYWYFYQDVYKRKNKDALDYLKRYM